MTWPLVMVVKLTELTQTAHIVFDTVQNIVIYMLMFDFEAVPWGGYYQAHFTDEEVKSQWKSYLGHMTWKM